MRNFSKKFKKQWGVVFLILFLFLYPGFLLAAEVLQVSSSTLLRIGDQNRTYTLKLFCIEVDPENEFEARSWLKDKLPRRTKVNFRPVGIEEGVLLARVTPLGKDMDLSSELISRGLGHFDCASNDN